MGNLTIIGDDINRPLLAIVQRCGGEGCPAQKTCAVSLPYFESTTAILEGGGEGSITVDIEEGPQTADGVVPDGDDYSKVGTLALGNASIVPRTPDGKDMGQQVFDIAFDRVAAHLGAGRCLLALVQNQPL